MVISLEVTRGDFEKYCKHAFEVSGLFPIGMYLVVKSLPSSGGWGETLWKQDVSESEEEADNSRSTIMKTGEMVLK